ncbi:hypothetical protein D3C80_1970380 [compost metagenome]
MDAKQTAVLAQTEVAGDQEGGDVELRPGAETDQYGRQQQGGKFVSGAQVDETPDSGQHEAERRHRWRP